MKRAVTGVATLVGLVLVICSVMGFVLLGTHGTWHSELQVPAGRSVIVDRALVGQRHRADRVGAGQHRQRRRAAVHRPCPTRTTPRRWSAPPTACWSRVWTARAGSAPARPSGSEGAAGPDRSTSGTAACSATAAPRWSYRASARGAVRSDRPRRRPAAAGGLPARSRGATAPGTGCRCSCWSLGLALLYLVRRWNRPAAVRAAGTVVGAPASPGDAAARARIDADRPGRSGHVGRRRATTRREGLMSRRPTSRALARGRRRHRAPSR